MAFSLRVCGRGGEIEGEGEGWREKRRKGVERERGREQEGEGGRASTLDRGRPYKDTKAPPL